MWILNSPVHDSMIVQPRVLSNNDDIPVFLVSTGMYSSFVNNAGERHTARPYVEVSLAEGAINARRHVANYYITAYGQEDEAGRRKHWRIASHVSCGELRTDEEVQSLIDSLADQIAEAVERCRQLDDIYAEASARLSVLQRLLPQCETRTGYEQACAATKIEALADEEIVKSYGIAYGVFEFPECPPDHIIKMKLAAERRRFLEQQAAEKAKTQPTLPEPPTAIERSGQLWEPCTCGREPVYMPLHLCDACWPKGA